MLGICLPTLAHRALCRLCVFVLTFPHAPDSHSHSTNDVCSGAPTRRSRISPPRPDGRSRNATQRRRRRIFSSCVRTRTRTAITSSRVVQWTPSSGFPMRYVYQTVFPRPPCLPNPRLSVRSDALCACSKLLDQPVEHARLPCCNRSRERCGGPLFDPRYELLGSYTIAVSSGNLILMREELVLT